MANAWKIRLAVTECKQAFIEVYDDIVKFLESAFKKGNEVTIDNNVIRNRENNRGKTA